MLHLLLIVKLEIVMFVQRLRHNRVKRQEAHLGSITVGTNRVKPQQVILSVKIYQCKKNRPFGRFFGVVFRYSFLDIFICPFGIIVVWKTK